MIFAPGDIGFVHNTDWLDRRIQGMQNRKYGTPYGPFGLFHREDSKEAKFNHVFGVVGNDGSIIEAQSKGVMMNNLSAYSGIEYELWRPPYAPGADIIAVHAAEELLGRRYGFVTDACLALCFMTNTKFRFGFAGEDICSGVWAYALTRANIDVGDDETYDSPADLYYYCRVQKWTRTG